MNTTFSMIKPDGVRKNLIGEVIRRYEAVGLKVTGLRLEQLTRPKAEELYAIHRERPFFGELVDFVISGPVVLMKIEGENAILKVRELMGDTDPKNAAPGTIRGDYAEEISENLVHGSDSPESAGYELGIFFA